MRERHGSLRDYALIGLPSGWTWVLDALLDDLAALTPAERAAWDRIISVMVEDTALQVLFERDVASATAIVLEHVSRPRGQHGVRAMPSATCVTSHGQELIYCRVCELLHNTTWAGE